MTTAIQEEIRLNVHPSLHELGPAPGAYRDRRGLLRWLDRHYTRLELPGGRYTQHWIDYETAEEAKADYERLLGLVEACKTEDEAAEVIKAFWKNA